MKKMNIFMTISLITLLSFQVMAQSTTETPVDGLSETKEAVEAEVAKTKEEMEAAAEKAKAEAEKAKENAEKVEAEAEKAKEAADKATEEAQKVADAEAKKAQEEADKVAAEAQKVADAQKAAETEAEDAKFARLAEESDVAKASAADLRAKAETAAKEADAAEANAASLADVIKKRGLWQNHSLSVGLTGSALFNDRFVGQVDGTTIQGGVFLNYASTIGYKNFELRNTGKIQESLIATPGLGSFDADDFRPVFNKNADNAEWESLLLYTVPEIPWVGPYARIKAQTQLLNGWAYFTEDTQVRRIESGDTTSTPCGDGVGRDDCSFVRLKNDKDEQDSLALTNFFEPLTIEEAVGVIFLPKDFGPWLTYKFQVGFGARHLLAYDSFGMDAGYVINDDAATPEIELTQLTSVHSAGPEAEAQFAGQITDRINWGLKASSYYALVATDKTAGVYMPGFSANGKDISGFALGDTTFNNQIAGPLHLELEGVVGFKVSDWMNINWVTKVKRQPFVLTNFQVQSQLMLSIGYSVF